MSEIEKLALRLVSLNPKKFAREMFHLAQAFDDFILECPTVPDDAVNFLTKLISLPEVAENSGIEHFLIELNVDFCKYSESQKNLILFALEKNAAKFKHELSQHSIGDFLARAYLPEVAFDVLQKLARECKESRKIAFVGLDVLRRRLQKDHPLREKVMRKWSELQGL